MKTISKIRKFLTVIWQLLSVEVLITFVVLILLSQIFHKEITTLSLILFFIGWTIGKIIIEFFYYHVFYEKDDNEHEDNLRDDIKEYYLRKYMANKLSKDQYDNYMKLLSEKDFTELVDMSLTKPDNKSYAKEEIQDMINMSKKVDQNNKIEVEVKSKESE